MSDDFSLNIQSYTPPPTVPAVKKEGSSPIESLKAKVFAAAQEAFISLKLFLNYAPKDTAEPVDPVTAPLREAEGRLTAESGECIEFTYENSETGQQFGTEKVERDKSVEKHKKLLEKTKEMLLEELKTNPNTNEIEQRIQLCDKELKALEQLDKKTDFISSAYVRKQLGKDQNQTFSEALTPICLGVPVNFRHHECKVVERGREVSVGGHFRTGVMAYHPNGFTNLTELKQLFKAGPEAIQAKIDSLKKQKIPPKGSLTFVEVRKNESIDFAISQLESLKKGSREVITERSFYLETQFSHLLMAQVEKNQAQTDATTFSIVHLGLLNRTTDKSDRTGWRHNEANQMQDMDAIFRKFDGKEMIFDGNGPYVDLEGNLHLPQKMDDGQPKKMKISATFLNTSVQGHIVNDGIQAQINARGIGRILEAARDLQYDAFVSDVPLPKDFAEGLKLLEDVKRNLNNGKSNYKVAENLALALTKLGIPLSIGCMAAKDRTGFVSARLILRHLYEKMDTEDSSLFVADTKTKSRLKAQFNEDILSKEGCASRVVTDNTGAKKLKISAPKLPGIGFFSRIKHGWEALMEILQTPKA